MTEIAAGILACLRDGRSHGRSTLDLSAALGISQAQIWKDIAALREQGYEIQETAGGSYLLCDTPDLLSPEEIQRDLQNRWLARDIHYYAETDSTNRVASDLARKGALHGTTVIAEAQSAGRGRLGRSFFSPPMTNLYTSIVLRPRIEPASAPSLLLAAGVAVADAVAATLGQSAGIEIKWPNDVLLDGLKTSGILMELQADGNQVNYAILGIGVNLNVDRESFPAEFQARATSLRSHSGNKINRCDFTRHLYAILERTLDEHAAGGLDAVRPRFEAYFDMVGQRVVVEGAGGRRTEGVAAGVGPHGELELDLPSGERVSMLAGDVTICKDAPHKEL